MTDPVDPQAPQHVGGFYGGAEDEYGLVWECDDDCPHPEHLDDPDPDVDPQALLDETAAWPSTMYDAGTVMDLAAALIEAREERDAALVEADAMNTDAAVARQEAERYRAALQAIIATHDPDREAQMIARAALSPKEPTDVR